LNIISLPFSTKLNLIIGNLFSFFFKDKWFFCLQYTNKKPPPPDLITPELQAPPQAPNLDIEFPDIAIPTDFKGAFLGPQNQGGNSQVIPLVRINPQYPRNELLAGVEGWVKVRFTVEPDGSVSSPKVVQSKPPRVFDTAALRAIKKWKFKPKVVNGVAVQQDGTQLIEFKLF